MTTLTVFSDAGDAEISSNEATYANARSGGGGATKTVSGSNANVGQDVGYFCYEFLCRFDTSSLGSSATISSATMSMVLRTDNSTTDFTLEARVSTFGGTVETTDWVAGANLGSSTLLASLSTSSITVADTRYDLTSDAAFVSNVSKTANTDIFLSSSRHRLNNTPTNAESQRYYSSEAAGTTSDPRLVVVYTLPSGAGSATGTGTATAVGRARKAAAGSASGTGTATAAGTSKADAAGSATGAGTATAVGTSKADAVGSASGTGTATGASPANLQGAGTATGTGTATAVGAAIAQAVGTAAGTGTATGQGSSIEPAQDYFIITEAGDFLTTEAGVFLILDYLSAGTATGTGTATAVGQARKAAAGAASGTGTATAVGTAIARAVGTAAGTGTATSTYELVEYLLAENGDFLITEAGDYITTEFFNGIAVNPVNMVFSTTATGHRDSYSVAATTMTFVVTAVGALKWDRQTGDTGTWTVQSVPGDIWIEQNTNATTWTTTSE